MSIKSILTLPDTSDVAQTAYRFSQYNINRKPIRTELVFLQENCLNISILPCPVFILHSISICINIFAIMSHGPLPLILLNLVSHISHYKRKLLMLCLRQQILKITPFWKKFLNSILHRHFSSKNALRQSIQVF